MTCIECGKELSEREHRFYRDRCTVHFTENEQAESIGEYFSYEREEEDVQELNFE